MLEDMGHGLGNRTGDTGHRITLLQGIALYVGAVLGTGVIALPSLAAEVAGPASLVAWAGLIAVSTPLVAVYAAGAAAGLRLLPRGGPAWWAAIASLVLVLALLALSKWYLIAPVAVAAAALTYTRFARNRGATESIPPGTALLARVRQRIVKRYSRTRDTDVKSESR